MSRKTPDQKRARELQKQTGRRYTDCLRQVITESSTSMAEDKPLPEPTPDEKKRAEEKVDNWLKKHGHPSPDPKDQ